MNFSIRHPLGTLGVLLYLILTTSTCVKSYQPGLGDITVRMCHFPGVARIKRETDPESISPASVLAPKAMHSNDSQRQKTTPTGWAVALGATLKKDQRLSATDIGGGDGGAGWGISPRRRRLTTGGGKKKATGLETCFLPFPSPRTLPPSPRTWASGGAFQEPRPTTQREIAEFPVGTPRAPGVGG